MLLLCCWELQYHIFIACEIARVTKWRQADLFYLLIAWPLCRSAVSHPLRAARSFCVGCVVYDRDVYLRHQTDSSCHATSEEGLEITVDYREEGWGITVWRGGFCGLTVWPQAVGVCVCVCVCVLAFLHCVWVWGCLCQLFHSFSLTVYLKVFGLIPPACL